MLLLPQRFVAWLNIFSNCNLFCNWCYCRDQMESKMMDLEMVDRAMSFLQEIGVNSVVLIGGEPTLHPYFFQILDLANKHCLRVCLDTNAITFSDELFLEEVLAKGVGVFSVSFKGHERCSFLHNTGKDLFFEHRKGIENLVQKKAMISIDVVVTKEVMRYKEETFSFLQKIEAPHVLFEAQKPAPGQVMEKGTLNKIACFLIEASDKTINLEIPAKFRISLPFCLFPEWFAQRMVDDARFVYSCFVKKARAIVIGVDGAVYPCNHLWDRPLGKLDKDFSTPHEYRDFMRSGKALDFYRSATKPADPKCLDCRFYTKCRSGCLAYKGSLQENFQLHPFL